MKSFLKKFFEIDKNKTSISQELQAGLTTFLSMVYVVSVHPQILSQTGLPFSYCVTATILVCFFTSFAMGVYANNPIILAPSLSLSSFFTFTLVKSQGVPYEIALGSTFWVGVIFFILSMFRIRKKIALSIPDSLKNALVCGIGLFIAFVGLKEGGLIEHSSETFLKGKSITIENSIFLIGLFFTFIMLALKIKGAFLLSIILVTVLCVPIGRLWGEETIFIYKGVASLPDMRFFASLDLISSLKYSYWPVLFSIAFVDLFDSLGGILGIAKSGPLLEPDTQEPRKLKKSLLVDGFATAWAGLSGSSSVVSFIESVAGIRVGGRTGLTAITGAFLFLPFLFLSPLLSMVPHIATAPILVVIGSYMMKSVIDIEWEKADEALPAFMIILLIPLCFSIIQGIIWGFLFYTFLKVFLGKAREVSFYMYLLSGFCLLFLFIN